MNQAIIIVLLLLAFDALGEELRDTLFEETSLRHLEELDCKIDPAFDQRIDKDLTQFSSGIPPSMITLAKRQKSTLLATVRNKQMHISGGFVWKQWKQFIISLGPYLPDMEFVLNFNDEPRVLKGQCAGSQDWKNCSCDANYTIPEHGYFIKPCTFKPIYDKIPLFSTGTLPQCFRDILFPSVSHVAAKYIQTNLTWQQKQFKAIWRGGTTGGHNNGPWCSSTISWAPQTVHFSKFHRQRMVALCSTIKDCDAKFSVYNGCSAPICVQMQRQYGQKSCIPMESQSINKLMIDIDGYSYSERFPKLLSLGSAVLKIVTFLDVGNVPAKPWVHYVPAKMDLSDFEERINWAHDNDEELSQIALRGKKLVQETLQIKHYHCYAVRLLKKYGSLLVSEQEYQANEKKKKDEGSN